jgi:hypothetical protein
VKKKPAGKKNGYVLVDVITTIFVATVVLGAMAGTIAVITRAIGDSSNRVEKRIVEKNEMEKTRTIIFEATK